SSGLWCSSCAGYHGFKDAGVIPIVVPEAEFIEIEREIATRDLMERSHDAPLDHRPEAVDVGGMDVAAHVFPAAVPDAVVPIAKAAKRSVDQMLIAGDQFDLARDGTLHKSFHRVAVEPVDHPCDYVSLAGYGP